MSSPSLDRFADLAYWGIIVYGLYSVVMATLVVGVVIYTFQMIIKQRRRRGL